MRCTSCSFWLLLGAMGLAAAPASAATGPTYEPPSETSPGVKVELKESGREKQGKVTFVYYNLSASGLAPGQQLNLYQWVWTTKNGVLAQAGFQVDAAGKVVCSKAPEGEDRSQEAKRWCQAPLEETKLAAAGFLAGQSFRLGLISADGQQKAFVETIPFPIESEDRGCRIHAECLSEKADAWAIYGEGFKPGESVRFDLKGPGGSQKGEAKLPETGKLAFIIHPPKEGPLRGSVTVKVEASTCKPTLRFKWGVSAMEFQ